MKNRPKLLYFVSVNWFFCSHFLERAIAARSAGYDVVVLTNPEEDGCCVEASGLRLIPLELDRRSLNPFVALQNLLHVIAVYRRERPDLVHHVALKPILLGTLAARMLGIRNVINAIVGMGYLATSEKLLVGLLRPVLNGWLKYLLNPPGSRVVFENNDDLTTFVENRQVRAGDARLIRGAGVDPGVYRLHSRAPDPTTVVLVARMLWDKGVGEFVVAARMLHELGSDARFLLVGDVDPSNRASIDENQLRAWDEEGVVKWLGHRSDIAEILAHAHIACLPSYREGLPKSLLEAMAAGLPCVTTDVPGCREAVRDNDNGLLVPPRDAEALSRALSLLIADPALAATMGKRGRARIEQEFSSRHIIERTLGLYQEMLEKNW